MAQASKTRLLLPVKPLFSLYLEMWNL